ncbi:hypothetical protein [Sulfuriferula sp.]|uniref:hypothetical protein n=1 Tax=Sulfuriferula sp. TaxID=2025307 RepID=UPI002730FBD6|nr:hypothetical protein [Sulfuriferula sp.]MDP2024708.1 hypothetical protein [Sulfuriferula sp.]
MLPPSTPPYLDWTFWAVVVSFVAIVLSQLPPVLLWFRPRRLDVEVHSRIQITHKVGNPNVGMYVSIRNTGGRELRIRSLRLELTRDSKPLLTLAAQNYFETPSSQSSVLFVPFSLKPSESWGHGVNFLNLFDRATEKLYRESESALGTDIRAKLQARPEDDKRAVIAAPELVEPFLELFEKLFSWQPGEYVVELIVEAEAVSASYSKKYRFTLYESDAAELKSHTEDYRFGGGLSYSIDKHVGVFVPLSEHVG